MTNEMNATGLLIIVDEVKLQNSIGKMDPIPTLALQRFQSIMAGVWILMSITGICTNVINLRTFVRIGLDDSVTISFFVLAFSDLDLCSIAFVELLTFTTAVFEKQLNLWFYLPPLVPTFLLMCVRRIFNTTTILITTFLALQRCLCVVFPFHVRGMFTKLRTLLFMGTIFAFSITCYSLFIWRHRTKRILNEAWNATQLILTVTPGSGPYLLLMEVVLGIGLNIGCQIIVLLCLIVMGFSLRKSAQFRESATSSVGRNVSGTAPESERGKASDKAASTKETQAMIQVALVSVIFIITNSPYLGFGIANTMLPEFGLHEDFNNLYELIHNIMFTAEILNSSVNFLVYYKYNSKFRRYCFRKRD